MQEGWLDEEYLVIFSAEESGVLAERYRFELYLPGYRLVGLRFWDDFIVIDPKGGMASLPTVPLDPANAAPYSLPNEVSLEADDRFTGRLKWYVNPLVFGGDPQDQGNLSWVTQEQHVQLVGWWNERYRELKRT